MKRALWAVALGLAVIAVAGCQSSTGGSVKTSSTTPTTAPATVADQPTSTAPTPSTPPPAPAPTEFGAGTGFIYTDGLAVSVLSAKKFTPSANAAGTIAGGVGVALQIRITNNTKAAFDPSLVQVAVHAGPNGDQGSQVVDFGGPVALSDFEGSIPVGQAATAVLGFDVPAADLPVLTVIVTPDFDHNDATLTGTVS